MAIVRGNDSSEWIDWPRTTDNADTVYGYGGVDRIYGHAGNDLIFGGTEGDWLYGMGDNDTLKGGGGADHLYGGSGIDTAGYDDSSAGVYVDLSTGYGSWGDADGDVLNSIENLSGSAYLDRLIGNDGANTLFGSGGDDGLFGGRGADTLNGGSGTDYASYYDEDLTEGVFVSLVTGRGIGGNAEGDRLISIEDLQGSTLVDVLVGNEGPNHFYGLNGNDSLKGGGGVDTLEGESGDDILDGGSDADHMIGRDGNDTYYVDNASDEVIERGGWGTDTVRASVSYALTAGADVETLTTTDDNGTAGLTLTGNASGNTVRGNNGNNVINGGDGNDTLIGLGGQDSFLFDTPLDDEIIVDPDTNVDRITDFNVTNDTIRLDATIFSSSLTPDNSVAGSQFHVGAAAGDVNHRIIYNNATGAVLYDSDGTGTTPHIQFATLSAGLADLTDPDPLTNFDFFVIA